ncbi:MAG: cell division protein FtsH, partial [Sulfurimonadaceae bacterium]
PRGLAALGYTLNTPEENKYLAQKYELLAEVDVLLGGRAAEEVFIGEISTGASNDLERATDIIKSMVQVYGMSDIAGLMVLEKQRQSFLGNGMGGQPREYSDKMAEDMDQHIKVTLEEHYNAVVARLEEYRGAIEKMVEELYKTENISGNLVREVIKTFEKENGMETKVEEPTSTEDEREIAEDMSQDQKHIDESDEKES